MATDDQQVLVAGTAATPAHFLVPGNGQIRPKCVFATYDGSGAASAFLPTLKIISDGGETVGIFKAPSVAAGGSADVSWFLGAELEEETGLANYGNNVLALGPWAFWPLSDPAGSTQALDISGHGRTLNIDTGFVTMGVAGLLASSSQTCSFSTWQAATNRSNFASAATQTFTASSVSQEFWLNTAGHGANTLSLGSLGRLDTERTWWTVLDGSGHPEFSFLDAGAVLHTFNFGIGLADSTTHHLVIVFDGTNVKCYVDGVLFQSQSAGGAALNVPATHTAFLGQPLGGAGSRYYTGDLGPCVVYDKALTAAQVAQLYNGGTGGASGTGAVQSVTATDASIAIGGTASNPSVGTASIDVIATQHPTAADWSNNSHKITSVTDPANPQDAATKAYVDAHAGVTSVFARTGAVVAANGDYEGVVASALTGATQATRYVGGTASGSPGSGTFQVGDFVVAQNGHIFVCTVAGTPGTWVDVGSVSNAVTSVFGRTGAVAATSGDYNLNQIGNATGDYSINSHKLTSVSDPTNAQDAATKNYVDGHSGGGVGGITRIFSSQLGGAAASIDTGANAIPSTYTRLQVIAWVRSAAAAVTDNLNITFNADAGAHQQGVEFNTSGSGSATTRDGPQVNTGTIKIIGNTGVASDASQVVVDIFGYASTSWFKKGTWLSGYHLSATNNQALFGYIGWEQTTAINQIAISCGSGSNLMAGSWLAIWGIV